MKYAVIRTGGKQYRVAEGDTITVERLSQEPNAEFVSSEVLLVNDEGTITVGAPLVNNIPVKGTVVAHVKGDKVRVAKFKSKVRFRKVTGHRQSLSQIKITAIGTASEKKNEATKKTEPAQKPTNRTKKATA